MTYIILLNYCGYSLTVDCVSSLLKMDTQDFKVVIVDNNSPDDSYSKLCALYSGNDQIVVLQAGVNNGFSAGNNVGINYALSNGAEYIMLLNNDTVVDSGMLSLLLVHVTSDNVVTPKMLYYSKPDTIWYGGGYVNMNRGQAYHVNQDKVDDGKDVCGTVTFVTGCCILAHRSVYEKVGLWCEDYFMYFEDVEFSLRLKQFGIQMLYVPQAKLWHKVGSSSGENSKLALYYANRNRLMVMKKYHFNLLAWLYTFVTRFVYIVDGFVRNNNRKIIVRSFKDFNHNVVGKVEL